MALFNKYTPPLATPATVATLQNAKSLKTVAELAAVAVVGMIFSTELVSVTLDRSAKNLPAHCPTTESWCSSRLGIATNCNCCYLLK